MKKPFRFVFMAIATMLGGYLLITHVTETGISQEKEKNSKISKKKTKRKSKKKTAAELLARGDIKNPTPEMIQKAKAALSALNIKPEAYADQLKEACHDNKLELVYNLIIAGAREQDLGMFRPLLTAARNGYLEQLKLWHATGEDINEVSPIGDETPLWLATKNGKINCVEFLLAAGADKTRVNGDMDGRDNAPFHLASKMGNLKLLKLLLPEGDIINQKSGDGTALYQAASGGHSDCVNYLLSKGADPNIPIYTAFGTVKITPLEYAIDHGYTECVKLLLASPGIDTSMHSPLDMAAIKNDDKQFKKLLKDTTDDKVKEKALNTAAGLGNINCVRLILNSGAPSSDTPFLTAIRNGKSKTVQLFLEKGFKDHESMKDGSALNNAAKNAHLNIFQMLLDAGADIKQATPICCYEQEARNISADTFEELVKLSIKAGGNLQETNHYGATPLHLAIWRGFTESVRLLIKAGADVNAVTQNGRAPLHQANAECTKLLIQAGGDINKADNDGQTPLINAASDNDTARLKLLINAGADINKADNYGWTPLLISARYGNEEAIKLLIKAGADINKADKEGETPLQKARSFNSNNVIPLLEAAGAK